jgi:hypothetical protein
MRDHMLDYDIGDTFLYSVGMSMGWVVGIPEALTPKIGWVLGISTNNRAGRRPVCM